MNTLKTDIELGLTTMTPEESDNYDRFRAEMFSNRANGRNDLNCTFEQWLVRQEKLTNFFDELMAQRENV
jgi:hypothetical protein